MGPEARNKLTLSAKAGRAKTGKGQRSRRAAGASARAASSPDLSFIICKLGPPSPAQPGSRETISGGRAQCRSRERRAQQGVCPNTPAGESPQSGSPGPWPWSRDGSRSLEGGAVSRPAAPRRPRPAPRPPAPPPPAPSTARLAFDAPPPANGRAGRRGPRRLAGRSARPGVSRAAATAAGARPGAASGCAPLGGCSGRRRARRGSASRRARGPGAWLRDAPPAAPPAWGNFTPSRVSAPARAPAPGAPPPSAPRSLTLCLSFLFGSRRRRRARRACSRRVQAQGEPGR